MDELDIDLLALVPRKGRPAANVTAEFVRDLAVEDLMMAPVKAQTAPPLVRLRDSHHALARVLAVGTKEAEASAITGYTSSRISILKADPQFQELLEFYRQQGSAQVGDLRERMVNVGLDAVSLMQERLEEKPDEISTALLKDIVKDMADRTGHAPQRGPTSVTTVNISLSERMAKARERTAEALSSRKVIDHE